MGNTTAVRRKQGQRRKRALSPRLGPLTDLGVATALGVILLALLAYAIALPPTNIDFAIDQPPSRVILRNFYGIERNATGVFRWSKPSASIHVPANAPATYRIALTLQGVATDAPRPVAVYVNGGALGTVVPPGDATPREYAFEYRYATTSWVNERSPAMEIELGTPALIPPGDPRQLGIVVTHIAVTPEESTSLAQPERFIPYLAALLLAYCALRALRFPMIDTAALLGGLLALYAALAVAARPFAFALTYRAASEPLWLVGALLFATPVLALALVWPGIRRPAPPADAAGTALQPDAEGGTTRFWSRRSLPLVPVVALALGLRLYHLTHLSLWLDEIYTVMFSRLPWATVLGLQGRYDLKPPLYFAAVKAVALVAPDVVAGRILSLVTGTLTVAVLYALVSRLLDRSAALIAALLLAASPLHLWYSQEARMYAPCVFLVGLSYLALVALYRAESRWWGLLYGLAALLAMYTDYSAIYALAPQVFLLVLLARRRGRNTLVAWGAAAGAVLGFLPWVPQVLTSAQSTGTGLAWYLGISVGKLGDSLLAIVGISGVSSYYWGLVPTPWARWPAIRPLLLALVLLIAVAGLVALFRRRSVAATVALGLIPSTLGVATVISQVSPGYADRTVLYAALGWALIVGAAPCAIPRRWARALVFGGVALSLLASTLAIAAVYADAHKQDYRALAMATAEATRTGYPIVVDDNLTEAAVDAYNRERPFPRLRADLFARQLTPSANTPAGFWYAYGDFAWVSRVEFETYGYQRREHQSFGDGLFLDFYARPDTPTGRLPGGGDGR